MSYKIKVLDNNELEQTIECAAETFAREPMTKKMEIPPDDYKIFARLFCEKAVADGLSVVAVDDDSGDVMGFMLSDDFMDDPPDLGNVNKGFGPILTLLDDLDNKYKDANDIQSGELLHLFMLGISDKFAGSGVGKSITIEGMKLAQSKGFKGCILEATGVVSQHIAKKSGFEELDEVQYESFKFDGEAVFADIQGHVSCKLMKMEF